MRDIASHPQVLIISPDAESKTASDAADAQNAL